MGRIDWLRYVSSSKRKSGNSSTKYSDDDWVALTTAFKFVSQEPIKGTDQSGSDFWSAIGDNCNKVSLGPERESGAPRDPWSKINPDMVTFSGLDKSVQEIRGSKP